MFRFARKGLDRIITFFDLLEYSYPARPGMYNIEAEAWPAGADDIFPPDNRDRITITVKNEVLDLDTEIRSGVLR